MKIYIFNFNGIKSVWRDPDEFCAWLLSTQNEQHIDSWENFLEYIDDLNLIAGQWEENFKTRNYIIEKKVLDSQGNIREIHVIYLNKKQKENLYIAIKLFGSIQKTSLADGIIGQYSLYTIENQKEKNIIKNIVKTLQGQNKEKEEIKTLITKKILYSKRGRIITEIMNDVNKILAKK